MGEKLMKLMDLIKGNVGLVFTKNEIEPIRKELITKSKKQCSAKYGAIAPNDVFIRVGPTNLEPTKTAMFQSMDISTRINGNQIDVISEKQIIKKGEKIGASEASLLSQLNIKPFWYGITVNSIYENGEVIEDASFLDINIDEIVDSFYNGLTQIAALCVTLSYPTMINVPHSILNAYKQSVGLSIMLETYSWDALDAIQNILEYAQIMKQQNNDNENIIETHGSDCDCDECNDDEIIPFDPFRSDSSSDSDSSEEN